MKNVLVAALGLLAIGATSATAADLPVKARPLVASAPYDWSGIYVGINGGWLGSRVDWQYHDEATGARNAPLATARNGSAIFGGQIGIQKQFGSFVLGAEIAANGFLGSAYGSVACTNIAFNCESRIHNALLMFGGRVGYTPMDRVLLFLNGGAAGYRVDTREILVATGTPNTFATSAQHWSGYLGGGVEYAFWNNWIVGLEYVHIFKSNKHHLTTGTPSIEDRDIGVSADLVRARLSYKFDWLMR